MKLVHLFKYYWPDNGGGIARAIDLVAHSYKAWDRDRQRKFNGKNNQQEIIVCWQERRKKMSKDIYNEIPVYRCKNLFEFASTPLSPTFMSVARKHTREADVVIYHFPYPLVDVGILLGMLHGKLVVWWHCDFETSRFVFLKRFYAPLVRHTLKRAEKIITCAEGNINGSKSLGPFKDKCMVIPHAVDDEWAEAGEKYYQDWIRHPNRSNNINILFIGRFVWYKGIEYLLRAYSYLKGKKYSLTLIGNGPLLLDMKRLSDELHLKNVEFVGSVSEEEKMKHIMKSDFMVLPSISKAESFAIVQIEAMSFGKPIINTRLDSGVPDVCPDGISGITVEPKSVKALYRAMKKLSMDDELRIQYSKEAMKFAREHYRMDRLIELYKNLFDELNNERTGELT